MKIAVLSGKGGTGKTLVSVNLAAVAEQSVYVDCDVEEPNGHLFFRPGQVTEREITVNNPVINAALCSGCRKCTTFCKFNALAFVKDRVIVFDEVCHSCGGCQLLCPKNAITEKEKPIGRIQKGISEEVTVLSGILNTGEVSGVPIIKALWKELINEKRMTVIDCPPGSACTVMESIKDADYCVLVAEPTIFGAHNLNMVCELVRLFKKPHGAILNKCLDGENPAEMLCSQKSIPILSKIPFDTSLGTLNAEGKIAVKEAQHYHAVFSSLLQSIEKEVRREAAVNP